MEPVPYTEFLANQFHRMGKIEAIIAEGKNKEFARILLAGKSAGHSGILLDSYVHRLDEARRIRRNEAGWVSVHSLFESRARDNSAFRWIVQMEPGDLAIDEGGNLYFSPLFATSVLSCDRDELRKRVYGQLAVIVVLAGILAYLAVRALVDRAA